MPAAVWVVMTALIAVTAAASRGLILDYRQEARDESAAGLIIADALHPAGGAERCSAAGQTHEHLYGHGSLGRSGRQISVTPSADAADSRPDAT